MIPADFRASPLVDDLLSRLHDLGLQSAFSSQLSSANGGSVSENPKGRVLDSTPFAMSMSIRCPAKQFDHDASTIIDIFAPKPSASEIRRSTPLFTSNQDSLFDAFIATRSRVVRFYNLPLVAESYLTTLFLPQNYPIIGNVPMPVSLWTLRDSGTNVDGVWAVFKTHEEARTVLALSALSISVGAALESDLEPYHKLQRFALKPPVRPFSHVVELQAPKPSNLHQVPTQSTPSPPISTDVYRRPLLTSSPPTPDLNSASQLMPEKPSLQKHDYTISSNPPNPRSNFRIGDWICTSAKCGVHNFGRNLVCIGCGCPRPSISGAPVLQSPLSSQSTVRSIPSPRFVAQNSRSPTAMSPGYPFTTSSPSYLMPFPNSPVETLSKSPHPLLTPSGQAFAIGGRIQNISTDPLSPCIMYWPDNEALPEQGQIRPSIFPGMSHPPILNTGNRGPISHQPGDWVCRKCNYLNWRRRKVCQTCLPYAEGNGDSISAAIQAERISLLTSVLGHTQPSGCNADLSAPTPQGLRSHSTTPPHPRYPIESPGLGHNPIHRSHSHAELASRYSTVNPQTIYQTSGYRQPSPLYATGPETNQGQDVQTPAPLLPAFLQDIIHLPTLSPSSTSSADLSTEDDKILTNAVVSNVPGKNDSGSSSPSGNIWRLDHEESRSLNAFALPNQQDLFGTRKPVPPMLQLHIS